MNATYFAPELPFATRSMTMSEERQKVIIRVAMLTRNISYSFFALLVWDMLLTLKDEVRLIWPARWTLTKWMFLINRYVVAAMIVLMFPIISGYIKGLTDIVCQRWLLINLGTEQLSLLLVSFIMVFRLHAAWGTSRRLLLILIALWLCGVSTSFFAWVHILYNQRHRIQAVVDLDVCFPGIPGLWRLFVPNACLHFVLLIILVVKAIATPRSKDTAMLIILLRDGIAFYSITFCVLLTAVVMWASLHRFYNVVPVYTTWTITTLSTSHFLLSLKYSQSVQQSLNKQTDIPAHHAPTSDLSHPPSLKPIEMEPRRDWKGRTLSDDSTASLSSRIDVHILRTQYNLPNGPGTSSSHAPMASEAVLERSSTSTSQDHRHYLEFAVGNQRRGFGGWWWWLSGHGAVVGNQMVEVDVSHAEWWDEWEDRGPGWQESQIGRYDRWL